MTPDHKHPTETPEAARTSSDPTGNGRDRPLGLADIGLAIALILVVTVLALTIDKMQNTNEPIAPVDPIDAPHAAAPAHLP